MLVSKLKPWNFQGGRYIIKEGEIGDMLFIIERGVCDACKCLNDQEVVLTQLKKGAFFGELAVMFDMPRTASVRAATAVTVLSLTREDITTVIGEADFGESAGVWEHSHLGQTDCRCQKHYRAKAPTEDFLQG